MMMATNAFALGLISLSFGGLKIGWKVGTIALAMRRGLQMRTKRLQEVAHAVAMRAAQEAAQIAEWQAAQRAVEEQAKRAWLAKLEPPDTAQLATVGASPRHVSSAVMSEEAAKLAWLTRARVPTAGRAASSPAPAPTTSAIITAPPPADDQIVESPPVEAPQPVAESNGVVVPTRMHAEEPPAPEALTPTIVTPTIVTPAEPPSDVVADSTPVVAHEPAVPHEVQMEQLPAAPTVKHEEIKRPEEVKPVWIAPPATPARGMVVAAADQADPLEPECGKPLALSESLSKHIIL